MTNPSFRPPSVTPDPDRFGVLVDGSPVELAPSHAWGLLPRVDLIVVERDAGFGGESRLVAVTGVTSVSPVPPALISNANVCQHPIAQVRVGPNQHRVLPGDITPIASHCPIHPPSSAGEPRTPVGEGGDTGAPAVEALVRVLDPDVFDPERPEFSAPHAEYLRMRACVYAVRAIAAGYRRVDNLGPIKRGDIVVFRGVDPGPEMQDTFTAAHAQLRQAAGHDDFTLLVLASDVDLLGDHDVVERVARAMAEADEWDWDAVLAHDPCTYENYTRGARAALAALRGQESGS